MNVLIVETKPELGAIWQRHLTRQGAHVTLACSQDDAIAALYMLEFDVIVLDLVLPGGSALAVADFASYRRPTARVIFVTNTSFFQMVRSLRIAPMPAPICKVKRRQKIWRRWSRITLQSVDRAREAP